MHDIRRSSSTSSRRAWAVLLATLLALTVLPFARPALAFEGEIELQERDGLIPSARFAGEDRFETAGLIATDETRFAPGLESVTVLVAAADRFPDALAGSVLGGLYRAPTLLTPQTTDADGGDLNSDLDEALTALAPETITILGGVEAVGADVEDALEEAFPGATVERIGGENRFETAALISDRLPESETGTAIVADGGDFPDALVAGAIASAEQIPILLTGEDGDLDPFTEERLRDGGFDDVLLAGGVDALSQDVEDQIEAIVGEGSTRRASGATRIETAVDFAREGTETFGFGDDHLNLATAFAFPDALTLGPHAGLDFNGPAPILLTATDELSDSTEAYLEEISGCESEALHVAGGIEAVASDVEADVREILTQSGEACSVELSPETATNLVGETHTVVAQVTDNTGNPARLEGETLTVRFEVTPESVTASSSATESSTAGIPEMSTAQPRPESSTVAVDANGFATFSFTSDTPGCVVITATARTASNQATGEASKCFIAGDGSGGGGGDDGTGGGDDGTGGGGGDGTPPAGPNGPFTFDDGPQGFEVSTAGNPTTNWALGGGGVDETDAFRLRLGLGATIAGYGDLSDTRLTSPELTSAGGPQTLSFDIANDTEDGFDFVQVRVSTDGGETFGEPLRQISGEIAAFERMEVMLGEIPAGPFQVRFQFVSDEIISTVPSGFTGSTIDNVLVTSG